MIRAADRSAEEEPAFVGRWSIYPGKKGAPLTVSLAGPTDEEKQVPRLHYFIREADDAISLGMTVEVSKYQYALGECFAASHARARGLREVLGVA